MTTPLRPSDGPPELDRAEARILERRKQAIEDQLTAALILGTRAEIREIEARLAAAEGNIAR